MKRNFNLLAATSLIGLLFHSLAWELWLAPLRTGGSMLALKALPLLIPVFGILRGKRYTHQWLSLFSLFYLAEGLVRVMSDPENERWLAAIEVGLAVALFVGCLGYARNTVATVVIKPAG
jgi:uncharacterized membrane protein